MSGDVSVLRDGTKSRAPVKWPLAKNEKLHVGEEVVTGYDGRATFQIADGSTFEVFPNSHFVFRPAAPNWQELLDVLLGKVRVHIEHLNGKPNPHKVRTGTSVISVRGTTFEITVDGNETTLVEVEEGLVDVRHSLLPSGTRELRAGEALRVYRDEPIARNNGVLNKVMRVVLDAAVVMGGPSGLPRTGGSGGGIPGGGTIPGGGSGPVGDTGGGEGPPAGPSAPGAPGPPLGGPGAPPPLIP